MTEDLAEKMREQAAKSREILAGNRPQPTPSIHLAVYYRVSTDKQDYESQKHEVQKFLNNQPHLVFEDQASGAINHRPGFLALKAAILEGTVKHVVVYRLDRLSRSAPTAIRTILDFDEAGVIFTSVSQPMLSTDRNLPFRRVILAVFAELAEMERAQHIQRVKAGIAARKARGEKLGPPSKISRRMVERILDIRAREGRPTCEMIAKEVGFSKSSVHRVLQSQGMP